MQKRIVVQLLQAVNLVHHFYFESLSIGADVARKWREYRSSPANHSSVGGDLFKGLSQSPISAVSSLTKLPVLNPGFWISETLEGAGMCNILLTLLTLTLSVGNRGRG